MRAIHLGVRARISKRSTEYRECDAQSYEAAVNFLARPAEWPLEPGLA
jgi:hypothetical protein